MTSAIVCTDSDDIVALTNFILHRLPFDERHIRIALSDKPGVIARQDLVKYIAEVHPEITERVSVVEEFGPPACDDHGDPISDELFVYIGPGKLHVVETALARCRGAVYTTPNSGVNCVSETDPYLRREFEKGILVEAQFSENRDLQVESFLRLAHRALLSQSTQKLHIVFNPKFHTSTLCEVDLSCGQTHIQYVQNQNDARNMFSSSLSTSGPRKFDLAPRVDYSNVTAMCVGLTVEDVCVSLGIDAKVSRGTLITEDLLCTRFLFFPFSWDMWVKDTFLNILYILFNLASALVESEGQQFILRKIRHSIKLVHRHVMVDVNTIVSLFQKETVHHDQREKWANISKGRISPEDPHILAGCACDWASLKFYFKMKVFKGATEAMHASSPALSNVVNLQDWCTAGMGEMPGNHSGYIDEFVLTEHQQKQLSQIIVESSAKNTKSRIMYDYHTLMIGGLVLDGISALLDHPDRVRKILEYRKLFEDIEPKKHTLFLDAKMFYKDRSSNFRLLCDDDDLVEIMESGRRRVINVLTDIGQIKMESKLQNFVK